MKKVAIMTDTIASVPCELAEKYDIQVIPFYVIIDGKSYRDTDIDKDELYTRLKQKENLPTTSAPSPEDFFLAYQKLSQKAESIIHISMTAAFTKEYGAALEAKNMAQEKLPKTPIEVIDSKTVEASELLIVLQAARAAAQGKNLNEVIQLINNMIPQMNQLSTRDTLFYLDKGGRIFEAKSWAEAESVNSFRSITEIDASTGGITKPLARAKTKRQIMEKLVDIARTRVGNRRVHAAIAHINVPDQAEQFREMVLSQFQCDELYVNEASATMAVQNEEGLIEFGFYSSE
ncbi:MAG TPA: DegV family protein [Dehalococcoidia bacterium]|nr:DegV family protein [Dehalococcoidia bacterium]